MGKSTWKFLSSSGLVSERPIFLHAVILHLSVAGAHVTVYEGQDTSSGNVVGVFTAPSDHTITIWADRVFLARGCYVDLAAGVDYVTIEYSLNEE